MPWVLGLVLKAWQFRVISTRRCICKNSLTNKEFQSWIVNFQVEVCAKAKNLALVLQWIKKIEATSSLKDLVNPKSITGKDFSDYEELDLMMAAELTWCSDIVYLTNEIIERRAVTRQKGRKTLAPSGRLNNVFQRKTIGSCSRRDACSFQHTHATGYREDNVGWSGDTQEILTESKHAPQCRKWRNRLTGKAWTVLKASAVT